MPSTTRPKPQKRSRYEDVLAKPLVQMWFFSRVLDAVFAAKIVFVESEDRDLLPLLAAYGYSGAESEIMSYLQKLPEGGAQTRRIRQTLVPFVKALSEAFKLNASEAELDYIITHPNGQSNSEDPRDRWNGIAERLLYMCAYWKQRKRAPLCAQGMFVQMKTDLFHNRLYSLSNKLVLLDGGCDTALVVTKLEEYAKVHVSASGRKFFPKPYSPYYPDRADLSFIATRGCSQALIQRNIAMDDVVPVNHLVASPAPVTTVAFSGESGSGKTVASLHSACTEPDAVAIYVTADQLSLDAERAEDAAACVKQATAALVAFLHEHWPVVQDSERDVAVVVVDELGGYPRVARALCDPAVHGRLATALRIKRVRLHLVGTGIDHALAQPGAPPGSYRHVRTHTFTHLRAEYAQTSALWQMVALYVGEEQSSGVFGRVLRLSGNARMGALLRDCEGALRALKKGPSGRLQNKFATMSLAEVRMFLAAACADVLSRALGAITQFNALRDHTPLEATTECGAAFALACSDTTQRLTVQRALDLSQCYGLITDNVERMTEAELAKTQTLQPRRDMSLTSQQSYKRCEGDVSADEGAGGAPGSNDPVTAIPAGAMHRFAMSAAAAELMASGFGLTQAQAHWTTFEGMLASLLALHAQSAACAFEAGIALAPVPQSSGDPLSPIKHWLRQRAMAAATVEEVTLLGSAAVSTLADARRMVATEAARRGVDRSSAMARFATRAQAAVFDRAAESGDVSRLRDLRFELAESLGLLANDRANQQRTQAAVWTVEAAIGDLGWSALSVLMIAQNAPCSPLAGVIIVGLATRDAASGVWGVADGNLLLVQVRGRRSSEATDEPLGGDMCAVADTGVETYVVLHGDAADEAGERPANVLAVTSANRDAAFYPTSWGDQRFSAGSHVSRAPHVQRSW